MNFVVFIISLSLLLILSPVNPQQQVTVLNVEKFPIDFTFEGQVFGGLSGLTYNPIQDAYIGITDVRFQKKLFYVFVISKTDVDNKIFLNLSSSFIMDGTGNMSNFDTESITFIENPNDLQNSYYIVSDEGDKNNNISNELWLYFMNGSLVTNITNQLNQLYFMNNIQSNQALEGISAIDQKQKYFVYTSESSLLSDISACPDPFNKTCVRISINKFIVNKDNDIKLTELYQLRYDVDDFLWETIPTDSHKDIGVSEIEIFENNNGTLYALVLERAFAVGIGNRIRIYIVDLTLNDIYIEDVSACQSLADAQCIGIEPIEKTLIYELNENDLVVDNYEVLNILYNLSGDNSFYNEDFVIHLLVASDNNFNPAQNNTYFAFLQWNAADFFDINTDSNSYHDKKVEIWMIIAIIFIVLFVIAVCYITYGCFVNRRRGKYGQHNALNDQEDGIELETAVVKK